ncbi:unnamed protein product [Brachionus calyciflorus]|uniref:Integrase catalytic domain-containing protein n=1 Tax=Brachionus calyciflorus TaxID=104777 RepID=A0A813TU28_9BILA|nr:unnamed protein product [Brachionus calyciflorus]
MPTVYLDGRLKMMKKSMRKIWTLILMLSFSLTDQQTEDKNIAQVIEWKNLSDSRPDVKGLTGELRTLWLQLNRLTVINGWPSQHKHIAEYIENSFKCQESKTSGLMTRDPLQPIITLRPLQLVTCDILGPLNTTELGAKNILEVLELLDVHKLRTTPYHQQSDRQTERFNRTLISMLRTFENENHDDWDLLFNKLAFAYRTAVHRTTGYTPFEMVYGHTEINVDKTKILYDRNVRGADCSLKDKVCLINSERKKGKNPKLAKLWKSPFEIIEILGPVNYKIKALNGKKRIVVHHNRLKRCFMNLNLTLNDKTCSREADVTLIEVENIQTFEGPLDQQPFNFENLLVERVRPDSVLLESVKNYTQGGNQFVPQDSIRDDSVPSSMNFQKDKRRVGRPKKGEIIIERKVQFKGPIRVQPTRLVKRK